MSTTPIPVIREGSTAAQVEQLNRVLFDGKHSGLKDAAAVLARTPAAGALEDAFAAPGEPVAYSLKFAKSPLPVNPETTFRTREIAEDYAARCSEPPPIIVPLYATSAAPGEQAAVPAGWKLVPIEPTKEMSNDGYDGLNPRDTCDCGAYRSPDADSVYRAMLAAAPSVPAREAAPVEAKPQWISVSDERKPLGRKPILVAVSYVNYGDHEDGSPGEWPDSVVAEGEYVPQHGEAGDYFTCYTSPHGDAEEITHWMPIPAAPAPGEAP